MTDSALRVVVVGRDADLWITVVALERAIGRDRVNLIALELPTRLIETDVYVAAPAIAQLYEIAGVDGLRIAAAAGGVPMVGQRFANWSRSAEPFIHAYDVGDVSDAGLVHHWVKARDEGMTVRFEDFSLAAAAAKQGKVPIAGIVPGAAVPLPGYQFDARSYAAAFKSLALKRGIEHRTGHLGTVTRDGDVIRSLIWEGDETFAADLFIDASGPEAILAGGSSRAEWESWAEWLPCDRMISASAPRISPLPPFSHNSAFRFGWTELHPLQDRTALIGAFASKYGDERILEDLPALAGAPVSGDVTISSFSPGVRTNAWSGNCVAVGKAAAQVDMLDAAELHLLHVSVANVAQRIAVGLGDSTAPAGYNQAIQAEAESIRDFQCAHYRLNRRFDEPFWDAVRNASGPDTLDTKISAFRSRGALGPYSEGAFGHFNWTSIFLGHGLVPEHYDGWVDNMPEEERKSLLQSRLRDIALAVERSPSVEEFLGLGARPLQQARP